MRGRAFSQGKQDCSGYELLDVIDAVEYVKKNYAEYIIDPETVYFAAGSGGGGNAFTIACKFPDYFAHVSSDCGMSDYEKWYLEDKVGEFQDELCVWIGDISNKEAYRSRSGAHLVKNLCAPLCITHGVNDIRVPISHSRLFVEKAKQCGKGDLVKILELEGVGGWDHFDKITPEQRKERIEFIENDGADRIHVNKQNVTCDILKVAEGERYGVGDKIILLTYERKNDANQRYVIKVGYKESKVYKIELFHPYGPLHLVDDEEDLF
jgi:pimeloyl-ACP methyl ester carboxylesterase